jgi:hypothetical protein
MAESTIFTTPVSAGLLPVNILKFGSITGVSVTTETTIFTHTFTGDQTVGDIVVSGTDYARFNVYINTVLQFVIRSGPARQANLFFQRPLNFTTSDVLDVKVIFYDSAADGDADFEATLLGI